MKPELLIIIDDAEKHAEDLKKRLGKAYIIALEAQNLHYENNHKLIDGHTGSKPNGRREK